MQQSQMILFPEFQGHEENEAVDLKTAQEHVRTQDPFPYIGYRAEV